MEDMMLGMEEKMQLEHKEELDRETALSWAAGVREGRAEVDVAQAKHRDAETKRQEALFKLAGMHELMGERADEVQEIDAKVDANAVNLAEKLKAAHVQLEEVKNTHCQLKQVFESVLEQKQQRHAQNMRRTEEAYEVKLQEAQRKQTVQEEHARNLTAKAAKEAGRLQVLASKYEEAECQKVVLSHRLEAREASAAEADELQSRLQDSKDELVRLRALEDATRSEIGKLTSENAKLAGHCNNKQKVRYTHINNTQKVWYTSYQQQAKGMVHLISPNKHNLCGCHAYYCHACCYSLDAHACCYPVYSLIQSSNLFYHFFQIRHLQKLKEENLKLKQANRDYELSSRHPKLQVESVVKVARSSAGIPQSATAFRGTSANGASARAKSLVKTRLRLGDINPNSTPPAKVQNRAHD
jgi:hypothetical protein